MAPLTAYDSTEGHSHQGAASLTGSVVPSALAVHEQKKDLNSILVLTPYSRTAAF